MQVFDLRNDDAQFSFKAAKIVLLHRLDHINLALLISGLIIPRQAWLKSTWSCFSCVKSCHVRGPETPATDSLRYFIITGRQPTLAAFKISPASPVWTVFIMLRQWPWLQGHADPHPHIQYLGMNGWASPEEVSIPPLMTHFLCSTWAYRLFLAALYKPQLCKFTQKNHQNFPRWQL